MAPPGETGRRVCGTDAHPRAAARPDSPPREPRDGASDTAEPESPYKGDSIPMLWTHPTGTTIDDRAAIATLRTTVPAMRSSLFYEALARDSSPVAGALRLRMRDAVKMTNHVRHAVASHCSRIRI